MSEEWISACAAWEKMSGMAGKPPIPGPATENIRAHAAAGFLRATAKLFKVTGEGQKEVLPKHTIPADFWGLPPEVEDWRQGRFVGVQRGIGWEVRCEALGVTFARLDIEMIAPDTGAARYRANAELECERWLAQQFVADPQKEKSKPKLKGEAVSSIKGLSGAAFDRAWAKVAPGQGRNLPGRKS